MKIGLYFGSFNPIHIGHLVVADTMLQDTDLDRVWFVVSPLSPFKEQEGMLHHFDRMELVQLAIEGNGGLAVSDIEFGMPQPSYTVDTLDVLRAKFPQHEFVLIMGEDNLTHLHKWKNAEHLIETYHIYCYPRPNTKAGPLSAHPNIRLVSAPLLDISATYIRKRLEQGKPVTYLVPENVATFIRLKKFYR